MDSYHTRLLSYKYQALKTELLKLKTKRVEIERKIIVIKQVLKEKFHE